MKKGKKHRSLFHKRFNYRLYLGGTIAENSTSNPMTEGLTPATDTRSLYYKTFRKKLECLSLASLSTLVCE